MKFEDYNGFATHAVSTTADGYFTSADQIKDETKNQTVQKTLDDLISSTVYLYKGSCKYSELPTIKTEGIKTGWVYNLTDDGGKEEEFYKGDNVAAIISEDNVLTWDKLSATTKVDYPVTSVNGKYKDVVIATGVMTINNEAPDETGNYNIPTVTVPVTSVNDMTGDVKVDTGVMSVTQDETDGHKIFVHTNDSSTTITIPDNDTKYTAGDNVTIDADNKISAVDTTYSAGDNVTIDADNKISATDTTYTAGTGIVIYKNEIRNAGVTSINDKTGTVTIDTGVLSITQDPDNGHHLIITNNGDTIEQDITIPDNDTTYTAGDNITISSLNKISAKDTTYSAGDNVTIDANNKISAVDTTYTAGTNITISDKNVISCDIDTTLYEQKSNKVTKITSSSTDTQYASAKSVWDICNSRNLYNLQEFFYAGGRYSYGSREIANIGVLTNQTNPIYVFMTNSPVEKPYIDDTFNTTYGDDYYYYKDITSQIEYVEGPVFKSYAGNTNIRVWFSDDETKYWDYIINEDTGHQYYVRKLTIGAPDIVYTGSNPYISYIKCVGKQGKQLRWKVLSAISDNTNTSNPPNHWIWSNVVTTDEEGKSTTTLSSEDGHITAGRTYPLETVSITSGTGLTNHSGYTLLDFGLLEEMLTNKDGIADSSYLKVYQYETSDYTYGTGVEVDITKDNTMWDVVIGHYIGDSVTNGQIRFTYNDNYYEIYQTPYHSESMYCLNVYFYPEYIQNWIDATSTQV